MPGHSSSAVDAAYFAGLIEQRSVAELVGRSNAVPLGSGLRKQALLARLRAASAKATPVLWDAL